MLALGPYNPPSLSSKPTGIEHQKRIKTSASMYNSSIPLISAIPRYNLPLCTSLVSQRPTSTRFATSERVGEGSARSITALYCFLAACYSDLHVLKGTDRLIAVAPPHLLAAFHKNLCMLNDGHLHSPIIPWTLTA